MIDLDAALMPLYLSPRLIIGNASAYDCPATTCAASRAICDYIRTIYQKLHVHSKTEAVRKALRSRIIS